MCFVDIQTNTYIVMDRRTSTIGEKEDKHEINKNKQTESEQAYRREKQRSGFTLTGKGRIVAIPGRTTTVPVVMAPSGLGWHCSYCVPASYRGGTDSEVHP